MNLKLNHIAAALIVLAATAAQATNGGGHEPTGDCNGSNAGNCNQYGPSAVGTGTSEADARAAANALAQGGNAGVDFWAGLSNQQRQALMSNQAFTGMMRLESNPQLSSALSNYSPSSSSAYGAGGEGGQGGQGGMAQARQALMSSLSNYSPSSSRSMANGGSATGGSGVGTVTVGDNVYYPSIPVPGAMVSAAQSIASGGNITVVKTGCVGQVSIEDKRKLQATSSTFFGMWRVTNDNGFEHQVRAKTGADSKLKFGDWTIIGADKDGNPVQEQIGEGFEYVLFAYVTGGAASSGVTHNALSNATAVNGNQSSNSFGTNVMEFTCSLSKTRTLFPKPKDAPVPPAPPAPQTFTIELTAQAMTDVAKMPGVKKNPGGKRDPNVCYGLTNGVVIYANGRSCPKALDDYMGTLPKPNAGAVATYVVKDAAGNVLATRKVEGAPGKPGAATDALTLPPAKK